MKLLLSTFMLFCSTYFIAAQGCDISLFVHDSLPNGSIWLTQQLSGPAPTYIWNTGATGPTIEMTSPGEYVVTATNANGCSIVSGYIAGCLTKIRQEGATLKAYKLLGGTGLTYLWNTGETTQAISPTQSGDYCVTVTGSTDCSGGWQHANSNCAYFNASIICTTSISYNSNNTLSAYGSGAGPFSYLWSPGNYTTQTIDPGVAGYYCVTITNALGCVSNNCRYLHDPAQCDVQITALPDSNAVGVQLYAQVDAPWTGDWSFLWSNDATTSTIVPIPGGEYCVTATNTQTGCSSSNCYWIWPDSLCYAAINLDSVGINDAFLSVSSGPHPIVSYQWNNGSTDAINQTTSAGWQTVTVTNSEGCSASASYYLYESQALVVFSVEFPDSIGFGNDGIHALLYLIEYDTAQGGILTAIDTVETYAWSNSNALGQFNNVPPGNYLVKAALLPNSNGYSNHLPTYYESALFWNAGTPYTYRHFDSPWQFRTILMIPGQNPGGPGFIGGLVSEGANVHGGGGIEFTGEGDPMAGISVVLTLANGTPVAATVTDANGHYSFDHIAWGTYTLTLDIPGLPLVSATVTIGPANPSIANVNFKVDENSIALPIRESDLKTSIDVFPNPTQDVLYIVTPEKAEITLMDALGRTVLRLTATHSKTECSLASLSSGAYILTVRSAENIHVAKVIKQ